MRGPGMGLLAPLPLKTHDNFSLFYDVVQTVEQTALTRSDLAFSFSKSKKIPPCRADPVPDTKLAAPVDFLTVIRIQSIGVCTGSLGCQGCALLPLAWRPRR